MKHPKQYQLLISLDLLICDEIGQLPANFVATIDIILQKLRSNSLYLGGILTICTLDHTQIQAIKNRPFLTSSHIISRFKMIVLEESVRAHGDISFQHIQQISGYHCKQNRRQPNVS